MVPYLIEHSRSDHLTRTKPRR